jgi:hypothetical protein
MPHGSAISHQIAHVVGSAMPFGHRPAAQRPKVGSGRSASTAPHCALGRVRDPKQPIARCQQVVAAHRVRSLDRRRDGLCFDLVIAHDITCGDFVTGFCRAERQPASLLD